MMDSLTTDNFQHARQHLLATEHRLHQVVDHFCSHELRSSEGAALILPFTQEIGEALREIRTAQTAFDSALLSAAFAVKYQCR